MFSLLMPYNKTSYEEHGTGDLFRRVDKCISGVNQATSVRPRRDSQGHSECPFIGELEDKARAWMGELRNQLSQLYDHERGARVAADRCRRAARESRRSDDPRHADDWRRHEAEARQHDDWLRRIQSKIQEVKDTLDAAGRRLG